MKIRKATPKDAKKISYLIQTNIKKVKDQNYSPSQSKVWTRANTPKGVLDKLKKREVTFCLTEEEKIIGIIGLHKNCMCGFYVEY